jgi:hypothetical protein
MICRKIICQDGYLTPQFLSMETSLLCELFGILGIRIDTRWSPSTSYCLYPARIAQPIPEICPSVLGKKRVSIQPSGPSAWKGAIRNQLFPWKTSWYIHKQNHQLQRTFVSESSGQWKDAALTHVSRCCQTTHVSTPVQYRVDVFSE